MKEKEIDKDMLIKYLNFIIEYCGRILTEGGELVEYDSLMRDYELFLKRLVASTYTGNKLKKEIIKILVPNTSDLNSDQINISEMIFSEIPLLGRFAGQLKKQDKIDKLKRISDGLSTILFKIEEYSWNKY
jgi:hypothetical protein